MINPIWIISFVEAVNHLSMAAAARHLKITSAAISKHILALEKHLGVLLFQRSTRRLDLTSEGELYLLHAKQILQAYTQAEAALSHSKEEPEGLLKIVCGPHIANLYVLPHLKEFLTRYPKLRLHLEFTQKTPDLEKENIDVVIGLSRGLPANCMQKTITHARWVLCASPDYLEKYGIPKYPMDLIQHRLLVHVQRLPYNKIDFKTSGPILFEPYMLFNDTRAMRICALEGLGIVQFHDYIVEDDLKEGKLIEILHEYNEKKKTLPIHISYLQAPHVHIKIRKFIDFIDEVMKRKK